MSGSYGQAIDVVCVRGDDGMLDSTEFFIKFSSAHLGKVTRAMLGMNESGSLKQGSEAFVDSAEPRPVVSSSSASLNQSKHSADDLSLQADAPSWGVDKSEPEWVDIYCNGKRCEDVAAFIGREGTVLFRPQSLLAIYAVASPQDAILQNFRLQMGKNSLIAKHRRLGDEATFSVWLYSSDARIVIVDIDGTITKADLRGYFESVYLGVYTYVHDGVVLLLHMLQDAPFFYQFLFLTSRPIAHMRETRLLLANVRETSQRGLELPEGPLFVNKESTPQAVYRELVARSTRELKGSILLGIQKVFRESKERSRQWVSRSGSGSSSGSSSSSSSSSSSRGSNGSSAHSSVDGPFVWGLGNKVADAEAYHLAGVPRSNIFIIDTDSQLRVWGAGGDSSLAGLPSGWSTCDLGGEGARPSAGASQSQSDLASLAGGKGRARGMFDTYRDPGLMDYISEVAGLERSGAQSNNNHALRPPPQRMEDRVM